MPDRIQVLLVEDDPAFTRLIVAMLSLDPEQAFAVTAVGSFREATAALAAEIPTAILLDLGLPDSSGLETFQKLRALSPDCATLIVSGHDDESVAIEAVALGAQDYLVKGGLSGRAVARAVRYAVERKRLEGELRNALAEVKQLSALLPICARCKQIRDEAGAWHRIESFITAQTGTHFSHGVCPDCAVALYGDLAERP
jgi:DNA-binding NarL/FixJ family response regulator